MGKEAISPLVSNIIVFDGKTRAVQWDQQKKNVELFNSTFLEGNGNGENLFSPSVACYCLRWCGYEQLGYEPEPKDAQSSVITEIGSAAHYNILGKLKRYLPRAEGEVSFRTHDLSGRVDLIFAGDEGKKRLLELKFVGSFAFKQLKKSPASEGAFYEPNPANYLQVVLYLLAFEELGWPMQDAVILYFNRDSGLFREAVVPWDDSVKKDAESFLTAIKEARRKVKCGELPEPTASKESKYVCKSFCPYLQHCGQGQELSGVKPGQERRRLTPEQIAIINRRKKEQKPVKLLPKMTEQKGPIAQQGQLGGFERLQGQRREIVLPVKKRTETPKKPEPEIDPNKLIWVGKVFPTKTPCTIKDCHGTINMRVEEIGPPSDREKRQGSKGRERAVRYSRACGKCGVVYKGGTRNELSIYVREKTPEERYQEGEKR